MLVNLESGCFDGFVRGDYDLELDEHSTNPGDHIFEKMTSGAYLGQLCLLTLRGAAREGLLTNDAAGKFLLMNELTSDKADRYTSSIAAEREFRSRDALVISDICRAIFERAARCVCANLSAILILTGRGLDELRPACVCADGSVIRYSSTFQQELNYYRTVSPAPYSAATASCAAPRTPLLWAQPPPRCCAEQRHKTRRA